HARPHLGARERDVDEAAMVPAQDPDADPFTDASRTKRARERIRPRIELRERQRAALVDQAGAVPVLDRRHRDRATDLPELIERTDHRPDALRRVAADQSRTPRVVGRPQLDPRTPAKLHRPAEIRWNLAHRRTLSGR